MPKRRQLAIHKIIGMASLSLLFTMVGVTPMATATSKSSDPVLQKFRELLSQPGIIHYRANSDGEPTVLDEAWTADHLGQGNFNIEEWVDTITGQWKRVDTEEKEEVRVIVSEGEYVWETSPSEKTGEKLPGGITIEPVLFDIADKYYRGTSLLGKRQVALLTKCIKRVRNISNKDNVLYYVYRTCKKENVEGTASLTIRASDGMPLGIKYSSNEDGYSIDRITFSQFEVLTSESAPAVFQLPEWAKSTQQLMMYGIGREKAAVGIGSNVHFNVFWLGSKALNDSLVFTKTIKRSGKEPTKVLMYYIGRWGFPISLKQMSAKSARARRVWRSQHEKAKETTVRGCRSRVRGYGQNIFPRLYILCRGTLLIMDSHNDRDWYMDVQTVRRNLRLFDAELDTSPL